MNTLYPQLLAFTLYSSGASLGATTLVLSSFKTIDGVQLSMADFGDKGFMTLEPGAGSNEEQISFSGVALNSDGLTTTLSGVKNVNNLSPYTETSGLAKSHSGGSKAVVAITSGLLNQFANKGNAETVTGLFSFPSSEAARPRAIADTDTAVLEAYPTFGQLSRTSFAGTVNASTIVKGIVELSTGAELAAGTGTGGTGALLVPAGSSFTNTSAGAGDVNKVPVLNASGNLAAGFIANASTTVAGKIEIATTAELVAGTATGGTGSLLVPANSSFIGTSTGSADSQKVPVLGTTGTLPLGFWYQTGTSGEAFSAGAALYLKASDSKLYKSITTGNEATFSFCGVAMDAAGAADVVVRFASPGQISSVGSATYTAGAYYYLTAVAGVLGTTPGTRFAKVAQAMSTTTLRVIEPKFVVTGSQTVTAVTGYAQTTGFYPAYIEIRAVDPGGISIGDDTNVCVRCNDAFVTGWTSVSFAYSSRNPLSGIVENQGSVTSKTATGFTLNNTTNNAGTSTTILWTAYSF